LLAFELTKSLDANGKSPPPRIGVAKYGARSLGLEAQMISSAAQKLRIATISDASVLERQRVASFGWQPRNELFAPSSNQSHGSLRGLPARTEAVATLKRSVEGDGAAEPTPDLSD
jgi:hypothetical protein